MKKLILGITMLACLGNASAAVAKTKLTVGYLPILDHLPLMVSHLHDNAAFKDVEVEAKMFTDWNTMVGAFKGGVINAAFILSPLAMDLYSSGSEVKTVLLAHRDGSAITVRKDSPLHGAADFKGKSVAIPHQKATHTALLDKYLRSGGLTLKDIKPVVIAPPNMQQAMESGSIEAFIVAEPFGSKAQTAGVGKSLVLTKEIMPHHIDCIVIVKKDLLANSKGAIQEWVDSLIRAGKFIDDDKLKNQAKVVSTSLSAYMKHPPEAIVNGLEEPSDRISFSDLQPEEKDFQKIVDISKDAGILESVNLPGFIDNSFYANSSAK